MAPAGTIRSTGSKIEVAVPLRGLGEADCFVVLKWVRLSAFMDE